MAVGYRAIFRLDDEADAIAAAEEQLHSWLKGKAEGRGTLESYEWSGPGAYRLGPDSVLRVYENDHERDSSRRRLYRLTEQNKDGLFTVSLYAANLPYANEHQQTIVVETSWAGETRDGSEPNTNDAIWKISPPKLTEMLLDAYRVTDGAARLVGVPRVVAEWEVPQIHEELHHSERIVPIIVAAEPDARMREEWQGLIGRLTRESVGVASVYVVAENALDAFNNELPYGYQIKRGETRTFHPGVDFTDDSDRFRHRLLTLPTFEQNVYIDGSFPRVNWKLAKTHAFMARRKFIEQVLPKDVRRLIRIFGESEAELARDENTRAIRARIREQADSGQAPLRKLREAGLRALTERPTSRHVPTSTDIRPARPDATTPTPRVIRARDPEPALPRTQSRGLAGKVWSKLTGLMERLFGVAEPTEADIDVLDEVLNEQTAEIEASKEQIFRQVEEIGRLNDKLEQESSHTEELRTELMALQIEADETYNRLSEATRRAQRYASALYDQGRAADVQYDHEDDSEWEAPGDFSELIGILRNSSSSTTSLQHIVFTGNASPAEALDEQANFYVESVWNHIRALSDYGAAKADGFSGNFKAYLEDELVGGHRISPRRFAAVESDSTRNNPKFYNARVFPVPENVDPLGRVFMEAHTKIATSDQISPRMHFYDDTTGTGKAYIGYIGKHLPNSKTS